MLVNVLSTCPGGQAVQVVAVVVHVRQLVLQQVRQLVLREQGWPERWLRPGPLLRQARQQEAPLGRPVRF